MDINDIIVSTRVRLARNFSDMPFPKKLKPNDPHILENFRAIYAVASEISPNAKFYLMDKLSEVDKLALLEKHLISHNLMKNNENGAVIIASDYNLSVMLNEEDHVRSQCVIKGYDIDKAYSIVSKFDRAIAAKVKFSFNENLGYLTSCPSNIGTGMRASVMIFLPSLTLIGKIDAAITAIKQAGLTVRGMYGEGSASQGFMYQISNQKTLGISTEDTLSKVKRVVESICESEMIAAKKLHANLGMDLEDNIMRAMGVLSYAKIISSEEFMELISFAKYGVILGLLKGNTKAINELIELAQPANLCCYNNKILTSEERDITRAELVNKAISRGDVLWKG